jgi:hypothetical protein
MYPMPPAMAIQVAAERQRELIARAEQQRLVKQAKALRRSERPARPERQLRRAKRLALRLLAGEQQ